MKRHIFIITLFMGILLFNACEEEDIIHTSNVSLELNAPNIEKSTLKNGTITFTNTNSLVTEEFPMLSLEMASPQVIDGTYNIEVKATISYESVKKERVLENDTWVEKETIEMVEKEIRGIKDNVVCIGGNGSAIIDLYIVDQQKGFVFSEFFYGWNNDAEGNLYKRASYIEIYNNSDEVLYADGLAFGECALKTTWARRNKDLRPDNRESETLVQTVFVIPGNGTDHPVQPGESIMLVDIAKNHKEEFNTSFDLSRADFEWYDEGDQDIDIVEVPNLNKVCSGSKTTWSLHNRGYNSFILFKMNKTNEDFITQNAKTFKYTFSFNGLEREMSTNCYVVANDKIIDAVELSAPSSYTWKVLSPALDMGWTHCGDSNGEQYGRSVTRKISHINSDGTPVLLDTNNSTSDFIATSIPTPGVIKNK